MLPVHSVHSLSCPTPEELRKLMRGKLSGVQLETITAHLNDCQGCQTKLDLLAEGDTNLSDVIRHIDQHTEPNTPAYLQALRSMDGTITSVYPAADSTAAAAGLDFLQPADTPDRIGKLGDFEIIREIGRGGMGIVLHAYDRQLEREVAVKVLDPKLANNEIARNRFCREARAAAAVSHENVVAVYSVHEDAASGVPYFAMQLVMGETLEQRIRRQGKLSVEAVTRIAWQAAQGLAAAHAGGLIHRDIKPGNILLEGGTERTKLTDFGLARAAEDLKLTRTGFVAGTPLYMAPEQAKGDEVDARSDLFSLGAVMYEALAGKPPFEGTTPLAVLRRVADEAHPRLSRLNPNVPDWLEDTIDQLLEKDPGNRIQSAAELAVILAQHFTGEACAVMATPVECTVGRTASRILGTRRQRRLVTAIMLAVPLLLGLGSGILLGRGLAPRSEAEQRHAVSSSPAAPLGKTDPGPDPILTYSPRIGAVAAVDVSSLEGDAIAAGFEDGTFATWRISKEEKLINEAKAHDAPITAIAISRDGKKLVTAGDDAVVKLWEITSTPSVLQSWSHPTAVRSLALDATGSRLASGDRSGTIRVWEIGIAQPTQEFVQGGTINALAFDPSSLAIAAVSSNRTAYIWDLPSSRNRVGFFGHAGPVYGVAFSHDGEWVATVSWDMTIKIWKASTGEETLSLPTEGASVLSVSFASCGKLLATGSQEGVIRVWDLPSAQQIDRIAWHHGAVNSLRFLPSNSHQTNSSRTSRGHILVSGGQDGTIRVWEIRK